MRTLRWNLNIPEFLHRIKNFQLPLSGDQRSDFIYSQLLSVTLILFVINLIQDLLSESVLIWGADFFMVILIIFFFLLIHWGFQLISKILGFAIINCVLSYYLFLTSNKTEVMTIFFPVIACAFLVFGSKHFWIGFWFSILSLLLIVTFEIYDATYSHNSVANAQRLSDIIINIFSAFIVLLITLSVQLKINTSYEKGLSQEKEKLQSANEELDRFVYSMSHDLRAPLSSIKGLVNIALKETNNQELVQYFPMIKDRIQKLESFTDDVTNYARNTRTEIVKSNINLFELATEVWESLSFGNGFSSVKIILDFRKDETITIDKTRLKILLNNIFSNAIKYQDFGKPSDERFFKVSFEQGNDQYKFTFEDNGIGIPEKQLPQIGTMFYRASYQSEGSGLGLFIAKQAIEKMNGQITFRSVLGKGTVIIIAIKKD